MPRGWRHFYEGEVEAEVVIDENLWRSWRLGLRLLENILGVSRSGWIGFGKALLFGLTGDNRERVGTEFAEVQFCMWGVGLDCALRSLFFGVGVVFELIATASGVEEDMGNAEVLHDADDILQGEEVEV